VPTRPRTRRISIGGDRDGRCRGLWRHARRGANVANSSDWFAKPVGTLGSHDKADGANVATRADRVAQPGPAPGDHAAVAAVLAIGAGALAVDRTARNETTPPARGNRRSRPGLESKDGRRGRHLSRGMLRTEGFIPTIDAQTGGAIISRRRWPPAPPWRPAPRQTCRPPGHRPGSRPSAPWPGPARSPPRSRP